VTVPIFCLLWSELAILTALLGSLVVSRLRDSIVAWRWGLAFTGGALVLSLLASAGFFGSRILGVQQEWSLQAGLFGRHWLALDELSALLIPLVALLHFLAALATGRTKMRRFSTSLSLLSESIALSIFNCQERDLLVPLFALAIVPAYLELRNRGTPRRLYLIHMLLYVALLALGWCLVANFAAPAARSWGVVALSLAVLIRCGSIPAHCWITDWFEHASLGNALLFVTPLSGVYCALRVVVPLAPDWVLQSISLASLITAVYAAAMAVIQIDARRFFAFLFVSHASLILVGLELHTGVSLTGALALWISATLSLAGLGLTLRALEARYGRLSLARFHGLYHHAPMLAVCFLLTGLASVGFPGTFGFVASELLIDGAVEANLLVGLAVVLATAINGIAVVRAYFLLFTGARHASTVYLGMSLRERIAVLSLTVLILGGGLIPQPVVGSLAIAAQSVLEQRARMLADSGQDPALTSQNPLVQRQGLMLASRIEREAP
jgi:NADH-quinone oxidoreductase subunit M